MKTVLIALFLSITSANAQSLSEVSFLQVFKSERRLDLVSKDNEVIKSYKIMLGRNPIGHKTQEGDNKTPEGSYVLEFKNPNSKFHKSLRISYPNQKDKLRARALGVKPGGDIMLHGYPNNFKEMTDWLSAVGLDGLGDELIRASLPYFDWTNGCIAVNDEEIDEIYAMIKVPTKIIINP